MRTKAGNKTITLDNTKKFLRDISIGRIKDRKETESEYLKSVSKDNDLLKETTKRYTDVKKELKNIFDDVKYTIFGLDNINEQPDTTDMPNLESEEPAEQRRKQKGQELKILTPQQMLSRLPI